jgi:large subunit ribosomal protein LP0
MPLSTERKAEYFVRMKELMTAYPKLFVVEINNVGSKQIQETRIALRGTAEILMGKNTMMRKCIREYAEENPDTPMAQLEECCRGNVGFVFTNGDLGEVRKVLESNIRPAPAKVGAVAPSDVIIPAGPTGCDPGQTAFFQTLQISTKITRGQIEMTNDTHLIRVGEKVGASQAALLQKLNIEPFTYGMVLRQVYDSGSLFDAKVLDITDDVLTTKFVAALGAVSALSLALHMPTECSVAHSIANAFKAILAVTIELETYTFGEAEVYKAYLADPGAFGGGGGGGDAPAAAVATKAVAVEEEVEEAPPAVDLFGGGDGGGGGDY